MGFINLPAADMKIIDFYLYWMPLTRYMNFFMFYFKLTALRLIEILRDVEYKFICNLLVQLIDFVDYVSCDVV